jgi:hypothetical protein
MYNARLQGQCHEIFDTRFFSSIKLGPWFTRFAYGFEFAEKFDSEFAKIGSRHFSSLTFTFSSNYKYACFRIYLFLLLYSITFKELRANIRFHKGFRGVTKDSAVSLRPLNPLPRSHWNHWARFCLLIETAESASVVSLRPPNELETAEAKLFFNVVLFWNLPFCVKLMLLRFF